LSTSGSYNVGIGHGALFNNISGCYNTAIGGFRVLYCNTTGNNNFAQGIRALYGNTIGSNNFAQGYLALRCNTTGSNNFAVGCLAGCSITTGCGNVIIGGFAGSAGLVETLVIQAGTCQRLKIDSGGLCINGSLYTPPAGAASTPTSLGTVYAYTTSGTGNVQIGFCSGNTTQTGTNNFAAGC
jgi:hypothetical protein